MIVYHERRMKDGCQGMLFTVPWKVCVGDEQAQMNKYHHSSYILHPIQAIPSNRGRTVPLWNVFHIYHSSHRYIGTSARREYMTNIYKYVCVRDNCIQFLRFINAVRFTGRPACIYYYSYLNICICMRVLACSRACLRACSRLPACLMHLLGAYLRRA